MDLVTLLGMARRQHVHDSLEPAVSAWCEHVQHTYAPLQPSSLRRSQTTRHHFEVREVLRRGLHSGSCRDPGHALERTLRNLLTYAQGRRRGR